MKLWLDAADASTITPYSNAVSQWRDKSGNSYQAIQSTAETGQRISQWYTMTEAMTVLT